MTVFMLDAFKYAKDALDNNEVPIGCVFVYKETVIAAGRNEVNKSKNATRHAEIVALERLFKWCKLHNKDLSKVLQETDLFVTVEPCIMCAAAVCLELPEAIRNIYYGAANDRFGGCDSVINLWETFPDRRMPNKIGKIMENEAIDLLKQFYEQGNPNTISK